MKDFERRLMVNRVYRNYIQFLCPTCQRAEIRSLIRGGGSTDPRSKNAFYDDSLLVEFNRRREQSERQGQTLDHFERQCKWCRTKANKENPDPLPFAREDPDKIENNGYFTAVPEEVAALTPIEVDMISPGLPKLTVQRHKKVSSLI